MNEPHNAHTQSEIKTYKYHLIFFACFDFFFIITLDEKSAGIIIVKDEEALYQNLKILS